MTEKIYVVIGESGEYSDRYEWCVLAVHSEGRAQQIVDEYDATARQCDMEREAFEKANPLPWGHWEDRSETMDRRRDEWQEALSRINRKHPDPRFHGDARYHYAEVELHMSSGDSEP